MHKHKRAYNLSAHRDGFTIVELLIVIVVIGILAAITIVAYNGITNRAHASAAQADANNLTKLLANANVLTGSYPVDLSTINNGSPLPSSDGTTYAYHPGASNASYCATITNGNSSFKVADSATTPVSGGCPGDGQGGVAAITNFVTNPSAETNTTDWEFSNTSGSISTSRPTTGGVDGTAFGRITWTSAPSAGLTTWIAPYATLPTTNAATYTASGYIRTSWPGVNFDMNVVPYTSSWTYAGGEVYQTPVTIQPNTWTRLSVTITVPSGTQYIRLRLRISNSSLPVVGSTFDGDAFLLTSGSGLYNYADGNTTNWIWNGTSNNSTSTGPPL